MTAPCAGSFGIAPGWQAGVAHLARARIHKTDVGRVACVSGSGEPVTRYFLGGASFGLSASIARAPGPRPHRPRCSGTASPAACTVSWRGWPGAPRGCG